MSRLNGISENPEFQQTQKIQGISPNSLDATIEKGAYPAWKSLQTPVDAEPIQYHDIEVIDTEYVPMKEVLVDRENSDNETGKQPLELEEEIYESLPREELVVRNKVEGETSETGKQPLDLEEETYESSMPREKEVVRIEVEEEPERIQEREIIEDFKLKETQLPPKIKRSQSHDTLSRTESPKRRMLRRTQSAIGRIFKKMQSNP